jgi:ATP adenylyltransferase
VERLWSPWRLEYVIASKPAAGCVFCLPGDGEDLVVFRGRLAYVVLNLYPYNNGHVMVVPLRHVATLAELQPDELREVAELTQLSEVALKEGYRPEGINVGINLGRSAGAGILEHLHIHLVPRWIGDANFMTVVGSTRVLPEELGPAAARLRPIFARLAERTD